MRRHRGCDTAGGVMTLQRSLVPLTPTLSPFHGAREITASSFLPRPLCRRMSAYADWWGEGRGEGQNAISPSESCLRSTATTETLLKGEPSTSLVDQAR